MQRFVKAFLAVWLLTLGLAFPATAHAIPILVALVIGGVAYAGAIIAGYTALIAFKLALVSTLGTVLISALTKPKGINLPDYPYMTNRRAPAQDHLWIYGTVRTGGALVYEEATDDNKFLWRVIVLANHAVESIGNVYAWDERLNINSTTGEVTGGVYTDSRTRYWTTGTRKNDSFERHSETIHTSQKLWVWKFPTGRADVPGSTDELAKVSNLWTANHHHGKNTAYIIVKMKFDTDAFPSGPPTFTADVRGKRVYDPRTGTTAWSDNWALCVRDFLLNHPALSDFAELDDVSSIADICDQAVPLASGGTQKRYTLNGVFPVRSVAEVLPHMLSAAGGDAWFCGGKIVLKPGYLSATKMALTEDDITSPVIVSTANSASERFNQVRGRFRGRATQWQESDYPLVSSDVFFTEDNDIRSTFNLDQPFCTDPQRCMRVAKIMMYRSREELAVQLTCNLRAFELTVGDVVSLTYARFGWEAKLFEVREWSLNPEAGDGMAVALTLRETSAAVYDWNAEETEFDANNTTLSNPWAKVPVGIVWEQELRILNQEVFGVLIVNLSTITPDLVASYEVEIQENEDNIWRALGSGPGTQYEWHTLAPGYVSVRARTITALGVKGEWSYALDLAIDLLADPPDDVTGFRQTGTTDSLHLNWNAVTNLDLSHYEIRHHVSQTGDWRDAEQVVAQVGRPATGKSLPVRKGLYLIKAVDKLGYESVNAATVWVPFDNVASHLAVVDEWPGEFGWTDIQDGGMFELPGHLEIDSNGYLTIKQSSLPRGAGADWPDYQNDAGDYGSPVIMDLGAVRNVQLVIEADHDIERLDNILWDELVGNVDSFVGNCDDWGLSGHDIDITNQSASIRFFVAYGDTLDDDINVSGRSQELTDSVISARYISLCLIMYSLTDKVRPRLKSLKVSALLPYVTETGKSVQSGTAGGGKAITFSSPFYETPAIMITPSNMDRWDFYEILARSKTGFTIRFRSSAYSTLNRTFDWQAHGAR